MALYLHLTTAEGTNSIKVDAGWFPQIADGYLHLPGGATVPANAILSTRLESKRETPARDSKLQAIEDALRALATAQASLGIPLGALDSELANYVEAAVALAQAKTALVEHDANLVKAKEAARLKKTNPAPAEPKAKVAKTKKAAKK